MLEGLEVTELLLSEAIESDPTGRLDSSFFEKRFIQLRQKAKKWGRLDSYAKQVVCGPFGSSILNENYVESGIPMIRPFNLRDYRVDKGEIALLEENFVKEAGLKVFGKGALMFARVGEIGTGINLYDKATISPNIIAAELTDRIDPYFVTVFANTKYGQIQLEAGMKVVAQPTISTETIRALRIPTLSVNFQKKIAKRFRHAVDAENFCEELITDADSLLLHTLGLGTWVPSEPLSYVRSSHEVFTAGRLDAEFFTPRVAELLSKLARDDLTISSIASTRHERFMPSKSGIFDYIEIGGLGANGTATSETLSQNEAPSRATQYVRAGDVVTSTVRPIRRLSALIAPEQDGHVCSSGFVVLQPRDVNAETLLTYLRLPLICELMDLHTSATMYPAISEFDLLSLPIPSIPASVQDAIAAKVQQVTASRNTAANLLNTAKRAVEIAIEYSEADALKWLETCH